MPKYTIIIPTRNSIEYLKDCIQSVISQNFSDYELIISDNNSEDCTFEYVESLKNPNIKLLRTEKPMAMVDHWEWVLKHSLGEWVVIVGVDDGVMPYFFELAELLTKKAAKKEIKVINSTRSYFFWKGCQDIYGDYAIQYYAKAFCSIKNSKWEILNALVGDSNYINIPQMYTNSLIHQSVIQAIKDKQDGYFYSSINPDANGAAAICSTVDRYLECSIPLGWIGSSPKSNGLIYQHKKEEYKKQGSINMNSEYLEWNSTVGIFNNDNDRIVYNKKIWFYEALLQTYRLQSPFWKSVYNSKVIKTLLFAAIYSEIKQKKSKKEDEIKFLKETAKFNNISFNSVINFEKYFVTKIVKKIFYRLAKTKDKFTGFKRAESLYFKQKWEDGMQMRLMDAYDIIKKLDEKKEFIKKFI